MNLEIFDDRPWAKTMLHISNLLTDGVKLSDGVTVGLVAKLSGLHDDGDTDGIIIQVVFDKDGYILSSVELDDVYDRGASTLMSGFAIDMLKLIESGEPRDYIEGCIAQVIASKAKLKIFMELDMFVLRLEIDTFATEARTELPSKVIEEVKHEQQTA